MNLWRAYYFAVAILHCAAQDATSTSTLSEITLPPTTQVITSVVTASGTAPGEEATPVTVVVTRTATSGSETFTSTFLSVSLFTYTTLIPTLIASVITATESPQGSASGTTDAGPSPSDTNSATTIQPSNSGLSTAAIVAIAVCITLAAVVALALGWFLIRRRRKNKSLPAVGVTDSPMPPEEDGNPVSELHGKARPAEVEAKNISELEVPPAELEGDNSIDVKRSKTKRGKNLQSGS